MPHPYDPVKEEWSGEISCGEIQAAPTAAAFLKLFNHGNDACAKLYYHSGSRRQSVTNNKDYAMFLRKLPELVVHAPWKEAHLRIWFAPGLSPPSSPAGAALLTRFFCP
jgi:hypothetical protein